MAPKFKAQQFPNRVGSSALTAQAQQLFAQGFAWHQQGRLADAQRHYDAVVNIQPRHFDALHLLGVIAYQTGQHARAVDLIDKAIAVNPRNAAAYSNRGLALVGLNEHQAAVRSYDKAIALQPDYADAYYNRGLALHALGRLDAALKSYARAIALKPEFAPAYNACGLALAQLKHLDAALRSYDRAIVLQRDYAEAHSNRGLVLAALGQHDLAIQSYERAIALKPDYADAYYNRGAALQALNQLNDALRDYDHAIALKPGLAEAYANRGNVLRDLKRSEAALDSLDRAIALHPARAEYHYNRALALAELNQLEPALRSYERAIELKPDYAEAYTNRGITLQELRRFDAAVDSFDRAIALKPDLAEAHHYRGLVHLATGSYALGWEGYEWRWKTKAWSSRRIAASHVPAWSGKPSDNRLLVWAEQGIGDQILYCSILQSIDRFPQRVTVAVDARLVPLFKRSFPRYDFVSDVEVGDVSGFDEQLPLGSLGQFFRNSDADFNDLMPSYLTADQALSDRLRSKMRRSGTLVCGLSWISKTPAIGATKSLSLSDLLPVVSLPHVEFVDLQYGDTAEERKDLERNHGVQIRKIEEIDNFGDIDGLASLIDACDLILTVSNTTAHLAGALGKETLLMLPTGRGRHWYWRSPDGISLWYPSIRVYEQEAMGIWDAPIRRVESSLKARDASAACRE